MATRDDDGFFYRPDDGKWVIHVRAWTWGERQLDSLFFTRRKVIPGFNKWYPRFLKWHHTAKELCVDILQHVERFATEVDTINDNQFRLVTQLREARRLHVLRIIHYEPKMPGQVLASLHRDFGLVTADCMTTAPGLCSGSPDSTIEDMKLIDEKPQHIVLFPGRKMEEVTKGQVPGLCHGVRATDKYSRGAVVFFAHGPGKMGASCPS